MQKICVVVLSKRSMHGALMAEENETLTLGAYITTGNHSGNWQYQNYTFYSTKNIKGKN